MRTSLLAAALIACCIPLAHAEPDALYDGELLGHLHYSKKPRRVYLQNMKNIVQTRADLMDSFGPAFRYWQKAPKALQYIDDYFTLPSGLWREKPAASYKNDATIPLTELANEKLWRSLFGTVPTIAEKEELATFAKNLGYAEAQQNSRSYTFLYMHTGKSHLTSPVFYKHESHCSPLLLMAPLIKKYKIDAIHPREANNPILKALYLACMEGAYLTNPPPITGRMTDAKRRKHVEDELNRRKKNLRTVNYRTDALR